MPTKTRNEADIEERDIDIDRPEQNIVHVRMLRDEFNMHYGGKLLRGQIVPLPENAARKWRSLGLVRKASDDEIDEYERMIDEQLDQQEEMLAIEEAKAERPREVTTTDAGQRQRNARNSTEDDNLEAGFMRNVARPVRVRPTSRQEADDAVADPADDSGDEPTHV